MGRLSAETKRVLADVEALPKRNTPSMRRIRRASSTRLATAAPEVVLRIAHELIGRRRRWLGYELIHHHPPTLHSLKLYQVEALGAGMQSWDEVDTFCGYIAGPCWANEQISDAAVKRWARSSDRWWRRAALVATTGLNVRNRGGYGDPQRTLMIATLLVDDHDDMVEKAMSWALRDLIYWDTRGVRQFVKKHEAVLGARVKREVGNKLRTGLKNPGSKK